MTSQTPTPAPSPPPRPFALTLLALFSVVAGLFSALAAFAAFQLVGANPVLNNGVGGAVAIVLALISLAAAIAHFLFAFGAWTLRRWGWQVGVAAQVLTLALFAVVFVLRPSVPSGNTITAAVILAYLFLSNVRSDFERD